MFHTPIINGQHVTKSHGVDAVNDDKGDMHDFDKMLDMDSLCWVGGLLYPFDNEPARNKDRQTYPTDDTVRDEGHIPDVGKKLDAPKTSTIADSTSLIAEKEADAPNALTNAKNDFPPSHPPLIKTFLGLKKQRLFWNLLFM